MELELQSRAQKLQLETDFNAFVTTAWPIIDPSEYRPNWATEALADHLSAVTQGQVSRLLVNFPPRGGKTNICSILWLAWTWCRRQHTFHSGPGVRFLAGSYGLRLTLENANKTRRLIESDWYRKLWPHISIRPDQNTKESFDIVGGGNRASTSVGGSLLGLGGDIIVVDDPHNVEPGSIESDAERSTARSWFNELRSTRLNSPKQSAIVVIMQRLHEDDVSGMICSGEDYADWTHLILPMEYEWRKHCVTTLPVVPLLSEAIALNAVVQSSQGLSGYVYPGFQPGWQAPDLQQPTDNGSVGRGREARERQRVQLPRREQAMGQDWAQLGRL